VAYPALADNSKKESPQATPQAAPNQAAQKAAQDRRATAIRDALKGLVDDKTLTAAQADKVASTLSQADALRGGIAGMARPGGPGGPGGPGVKPGGGLLGVEGPEADAAAAKVLGLSVGDLRTALGSGSTLADLAKKQGKSVDTLVSALVAVAENRLNAEVKAGRLTQDTATQIEKTLDQRVRTVVQHGRPEFVPMGGRWHDNGPAGSAAPGQTPPSGSPKPGPSSSTSASSASFGSA
jgi:hypothetical protein